jgi:chitodextrinase
MTASQYDIVIDRGSTFLLTFTYATSAGVPIDLTGYTARMQIRKKASAPVIMELNTANGRIVLGGTAGTVTLTLSAAETTTLPAGQYQYDLNLITGIVSIRFVEGRCSIRSNVIGSVTTPAPDTTAPTIPTALVVTDPPTLTQVSLSWTGSTDVIVSDAVTSGIAGYKVYKDGVLLATLGAVTVYTATGLTQGTTYSFTVTAYDVAGNESAPSTARTVTTLLPDATAPTVPADLALTVRGTTAIDLTWTGSVDPGTPGENTSGLVGYHVYKDGVLLTTLGVVTAYSAVGLTAGTLYSFRISAFDAIGNESAQCAAVTATTDNAVTPGPDVTPPSVPTGLAVAVISTTELDLSWNASTDPTVANETRSGLSGYKVYKDGSLLATLGVVTTYSATGLTPGTLYSFRVLAFDAAGNASAQCTAVTKTTTALDTTAPNVPTGLAVAVISTTELDLSWNAATDPTVAGALTSGLAGYEVYKDGSLLDTLGLVTSYSATGLTAGTLYSFRVRAFDADGNASAQCTAVTGTTLALDTTAPSVPTGLALTVRGTDVIDLDWNASSDTTVGGAVTSGLAGYNIYKDGSLLDTVGLVTSYSASGLTANTLYSFRVSAFDVATNESAQCSAQTATTDSAALNPDTTPPSVPTGLAVAVISTTQLNLTWNVSTDPTISGDTRSGLAGYKVYKDGSLLATLGGVTSYSATGLTPGTLYSFRVSAYDIATNESAQCTAVTNTTTALDTTAPSVPTGLAVAVISTTQLNLSWSASSDTVVGGAITSGLSGYKVYKDGSLLATLGTVTSYSATGLTPGTLYSFRVSAYDVATNESAQCTAVTGTTLALDTTAPSVPTGLALAVTGTSTINLSWNASSDTVVSGAVTSGLSGYKVYKNGVLLATLGNVTSYGATGLTANTSYSFRVSAYDAAANESAQCTAVAATTDAIPLTPDVTAPTVPTGLALTVISTSQINLAWNVSTDPAVAGAVRSGLAGYKVYKGGVLLATLGTVNTYSAVGLTASTSYTFTVAAYDAAGNLSAQSTGQTATTSTAIPSNPPDQVTGLAVSSFTYASVSLAWNVANGALTYSVERSPNGSSSWVVIGTPSSNSFVDNSVAPSTLYFYRVRGTNTFGSGTYSSTVSVTTATQPVAGSALADWNVRAGGAGVIWAHRFTTPNDSGLWFGTSPQDFSSKKRCGYIGPAAPTGVDIATAGHGYMTSDGVVRADAGIIGDGCMELYVPAYTDTGGLKWSRPLAPTTGAMTVSGGGMPTWTPNDTSAVGLDINTAGLPRYNPKNHVSTYPGDVRAKLGGMVGGMISNAGDLATYQRTVPTTAYNDAANEISYAGADGIYIQFRQKFKTMPSGKNRLDYADGRIYTSNAVQSVVNAGTLAKTGQNVYSLTASGTETLANVGQNHELQAPKIINGTEYAQYITLSGCGSFDGTWKVTRLDTSSSNKVYLALNSTGFPAYPASTGDWATTLYKYELKVGTGHDFWTPITAAGSTYRQRLDVSGGTFAGTYASDGITTDGVVIQAGWLMPAFTGPATVSGYYGPSEGKLWNIYTQPSNSGGLSSQIVCTTRPDIGAGGSNAFFIFGNAGAWLYEDGLNQQSASHIQNQISTCHYIDPRIDCFLYPKDEWVTVLLHLIPGRQNPGRQLVPNLTAQGSLPVASITRGINTVIHVPGLASVQTLWKFATGTYFRIEGTEPNWSDPTVVVKPVGQANFDYVAETITFPWNTTAEPAYTSGGTMRIGTLQGWDTWKGSTPTHFDMTIEVWVATQTMINAHQGYRKLHSYTTYPSIYDTDYGVASLLARYPDAIKNTPTASGYNYIEFYTYMNPGTGASVPYAFPLWVLIDQPICSTNFIPCPTV